MSEAKSTSEAEGYGKKIKEKTKELEESNKAYTKARNALEDKGFVIISSSNCVDEVTASMIEEDTSKYATNICSTTQAFGSVMEKFVANLSGLIGAITVGGIVLGGFQYITSEGDPKKLTMAKETIFYSSAGLVVVLCTFMISSLIVSAFS